MERGFRIAVYARLYMLLGKYPEYLTAKTGERIDRALDAPIALNGFDLTLLMAATEIDRVCAHTVMVLRDERSKGLLNALGVMDPDRIVAMYYALPNGRREVVRQDPAWAYHIDHAPEGMPERIDDVAGWCDDWDRTAAHRSRLAANVPVALLERINRAERVMLRHQAGLPTGATPAEVEMIEQSERVGAKLMHNIGLINEELLALPDPNDGQAQGEAIRRAMARMG
jgi:hypothetical protein